MPYIRVGGRWFDIIVINVHVPTEDKRDDTKDSFCEELEGVLDQFPKYNMQILLGYFNAKVGSEFFLNRPLGLRVCTKLEMIMRLE
jgi:hypothetical protein